MRKVILIHANCVNAFANGDYVFAANIAKDLYIAMREKHIEDVQIMLISAPNGVRRFLSLYGLTAHPNKVNVDGISFHVTSFMDFNTIENQTIAFIDANRCSFERSEIVKRVLSPESKLLLIGNQNQPVFANEDNIKYLNNITKQQPMLYEFFDSRKDIWISSAGFGKDRIGLPSLKSAGELEIVNHSHPSLPLLREQKYGFMYLAMLDLEQDIQLIAQYLKLTALDQYCLVGKFENKLMQIILAYEMEKTLKDERSIPNITFYDSLPNDIMRRLSVNATGLLVVSTGVTSTLEVLKDGKLPFYQYLNLNDVFVKTYLSHIKALIDNDILLSDQHRELLNNLACLLFSPKPLIRGDLIQVDALLKMPAVASILVKKNLQLLNDKLITGNIGLKIMDFILSNHLEVNDFQKQKVRISLIKGDEKIPSLYVALRRAAAFGRIFELKVLIRGISKAELDIKDKKERSAINLAVQFQQYDCVNLLVNAGADLNTQDTSGQTPLHLAASLNNHFMIKLLICAGASLEIRDEHNRTPRDCAQPETLDFIQTCCKS